MKFMSFDELDKIRLTKEFSDKGRYLNAGLIGTIIYRHKDRAYEVDFPCVQGFSQISKNI